MNSSYAPGTPTAPAAVMRRSRLLPLATTLAVVFSAFGATPALAAERVPAPSSDTSTTSTLEDEIGERGSFMGQSIAAKRQNLDVQEASGRQLMEARAGELADAPSGEPLEARRTWKAPGINGLDVSGWQPSVNWQRQWNMGARFAYVKATEGNTFVSGTFDRQYIGSYNVGMIRGAYHFALPQVGNARSQARFFVNNGGGWSPDGRTLPPLLDLEHNPYESLGGMCYNMSASQLVNWAQTFSRKVENMTGRKPMIYTTYGWWTQCTNNSKALDNHPLHVAAYPYPGYEDGFDIWMFGGWEDYTVWQYSATGPFAGDSNHFNGSYKRLKAFAKHNPNSVSQDVIGFTDVSPSTPFYKQIRWASDTGITNGWDDGTFRPHADTNRDAMAAFLYRMHGEPAFNPPNQSPFTDYPTGSKFYKEVTWLEASGITNGWDDGTFRPRADINRDAMAAFLYRMAGTPRFNPPNRSPFTDVQPGDKFYKEITWLHSTGITTGWDDGTFRPRADINRDATVTFLWRYQNKY